MVDYFFCFIFVLSIKNNSDMKTIYYVIEKQLQDLDGFEETTGWKYVRAYAIKNGKLELVCELDIENSENTEIELLNELESENHIEDKCNLIQL